MGEEGKVSLIEQHIGTILQLMVVGLLAWSLMTIQSMSKDMEVLKVKVESMNATMTQGTNDRYRGTDAARDFASLRQELQFLEKRINSIEAKMLK
jgi:hypothetical protein